MLPITVPASEQWDEQNCEFINTKECKLQLEHSLVSISKWEQRWRKPFYLKEPKTREETIDYIKCMTITQNVDPLVYQVLTDDNMNAINSYMDDPMTATFVYKDQSGKTNREQVTSELIYYWMIELKIPFECQKWHMNRLLTLIEVCNVKSQPPKKMSQKERLALNARLNAERKKKLNTTG